MIIESLFNEKSELSLSHKWANDDICIVGRILCSMLHVYRGHGTDTVSEFRSFFYTLLGCTIIRDFVKATGLPRMFLNGLIYGLIQNRI